MKLARLVTVLLTLLLIGACTRKHLTPVDIYYTADVQGVYWPRPEPRFDNKEVGGYGVLKNFLDKQTQSGVPFLLVDGGNWMGVTPEGTLSKGSVLPKLTAGLPYAVAGITEKELEYGWPALRQIVRELPYPFLASNLRLDNKIPWPMHDYQIKTVNGVKIGFFAVVSDRRINALSSRLTGMRALDAVQTAQEMAALLREKGVHAVVMLSALGEGGKDDVTDSQLAAETSGIDLILSSNLDRENPETDKINQTFIVYPGSKLDSVAKIRLSFDKNKHLSDVSFEDILLEKAAYGEDPQITQDVADLRAATRRQMDARVTSAKEEITGNLHGESVLGDLLADCVHKWAKLDGVVLNSDSLRANLPAGKITEYDVYKMYPYNDNLTFITIRGEAFRRALEASLADKDNFPQTAGITITYDPAAAEGNRIQKITFQKTGRALRPQEVYRFAVTDHVLAGGFGHDGFINSLEFKNTFVPARQIMRACLVRQKEISVPSLGRWKQVP